MSRSGTPPGYALAALLILLLGSWARLASFDHIFTGGRVELVPADSHYHVRLALLQLAGGAMVDADPFVAFPVGAGNYWPPLHALLVALLVSAVDDPELGAAFVGPMAGILGLVAVGLVARATIGSRLALGVLFLLAMTPIAIESAAIGNADHHVHEPIVAALVALLGFAAARGSRHGAVALGLVAGGARLFTTVGFVLPAMVAVAYVVAAWASPATERVRLARSMARTGAAATAMLAAMALAFGDLSTLDYEALSAFHPLLAAAIFAAATATSALFGGDRRLAIRAAPFVLPLAVVAPQLWRVMEHFGRADPLLAIIGEARSLAAAPVWAAYLFGPVLLALPVALIVAARALARRKSRELAAPFVAAVCCAIGAAQQVRFAPMLSGAAAVLLPLAFGMLASRLSPRGALRLRYALAAGAAMLLLVLIPPPPPRAPGPARMIRPTLEWMRANLPPASADPRDARARPEYGVLAPFEYGHFIALYAERPALASTFSQTRDHVRANRLASEILAEPDEEVAYARMRHARLRYLLRAPTVALLGIAQPRRDALLLRLQRGEALGHFRPVFESREQRRPGHPYATVFELVEGVILEGKAPPGTPITATLDSTYVRLDTAGSHGRFAIRVARPGNYQIVVGQSAASAAVSEEQVRTGARIIVTATRP